MRECEACHSAAQGVDAGKNPSVPRPPVTSIKVRNQKAKRHTEGAF